VGGVAMGAGATIGGPQEAAPSPAGTPPTQTSTPPVTPALNETKAQSLEAMRSRIDAALAEAQAVGNTAGVEELQEIKARLDSELGAAAPVQETPGQVAPAQEAPVETPVETPPITQTVPPTQEATPPVQETPLDIPPVEEQAPIVNPNVPPVMQSPVPPQPGETVQLKRGEEIILTPQGQSETRVVPTEEEKANLQQLLGEHPTAPITQPEVIPNAEEVQAQTEAPVNTRFSMPRRQPTQADATERFDPTIVESNAAPRFKSRDKLVSMPIADFLAMADKLDVEEKDKTANIAKVLDKDIPLSDLPFLQIKNGGVKGAKVVGHEGRHRALELQRRGYTHMPVVLATQDGGAGSIRWSQQGNKANFDYIDDANWPTELVSENDSARIPFPVTRERATTAYGQKADTANETATEATMEEFEAVRKQFQERQKQETPFKNWFGKGVPGVTTDSTGTPITLYHGTNNPTFNQWDSSRAGEASTHPTSGLGFFMTADKGAAARYGNNLMALHAKIQNPYELTDADLTSIETKEDAAKLRKKLIAKGYDGAVVKAPGAKPYVIAFESKQVKFVTNEKPTDSEDFRYSFAGQRAATANLMALETAEKRIALGDNSEVVRQETGWHQGADKKWRFEISDEDMDWKKSFDAIPESELFKEEKAIPLSEVIDHPELFAAYPFLEAIQLIKRKAFADFRRTTQGYFNDNELKIVVTPYAQDPLSTLLHEIQHAIQMYEGFAKGGNENSVWEALPVETKENIAKGAIEELKGKVVKARDELEIATLLGDNTDLIMDYNEASNKEDALYDEFKPYEDLPFDNPKRKQKVDAWLKAKDKVSQAEKRISSLFDYEDESLINLPYEIHKTVTLFAKFAKSGITNFKDDITKHKSKLNTKVTELLSKIAAIKSGDEKAIRAEANLYEFYKKLAGETEARLTQARQGMTEGERKQQSPQSMQEYPDEEQIVVMQGGQSLSAEQGSAIRPVTPDELRTNINSVMGENWIQQAEAAGIVEIIDGAGSRGESGSWAGDKFRLYTQTMPADGSPLGVLLHEGSHASTFNEILGDSLEGYLKDLDTLAEGGNKTAQNAITQATIAVADVLGIKHNLLQGGSKADLKNIQALIEERKPGLLAEEKLAYFIQYGSETKDGAGLLKRLINAIKAWFAQTQLGQALKQAGIGFELNEAMAVEWAKASLRNSLAEAQQAARARELAIAEAKEMPPSVRLGRTLEAQYSVAPEGTLQDIPKDSLTDPDIRYSMGLQEFKDTLWTDPTDSRQDFVNKPGLLQKFRANFIDFFAEIEKKSTQVYDAYSLLRNKKAARLVQARQEYMFPLRDLIAKSPWTSKEVGDMLAARHLKVDKVNIRLAERASYNYTKELLKSLPDSKRKELMKARSNVKGGLMPDGSAYLINGSPATMSARTKQKLMFDLMNKYVEFETFNPDGKQELRFEWEVFKDAAGGFSNGGVGKGVVRSIDDVLANTSKDQAKFDKIASLFDAMNRHALQIREDGELITPAEHARLLLDKTAYAPLRRESYNVDREIEQLFKHAGQGGSKQLGVRTGTVALSEPTLVLQNALAALEASAAAAERNLANKELYKVISADKEAWKPWFAIVDSDKYMTHDEDGFLQDRNATASNRADITLINKGKKLVIRPNMHNERAIGFVRAVNNLDSQVISGPMSVLNFFNNIVRWVNVTASPAFLMMNAIRDPGTALYNMQATEAAPYTSEIFANYGKSFKALKKVFLDGNRDPTDADVQMVERFENAGGRTSFIEQLNPSDDTWRSFDAQVARRQGSMKQIMAAKDKWIDGLENFNVLFENVMRLSTFNVLVDKGTSKTRAARIAQDLTTNFTRRGYKTQALGNWWVFFNAAVQGNYQVVRNLLASKKLQVWAGGTIVFALMLDLLGRAVADDWDEIPEWDKERFIILPVKVAGDFVKIPAPWVYNVLWRAGGMFGEALAGVRKPQDMVLDLAALTATTFNPLGKPGSIAQAIAPTAADPFVQILENKDFAGNPIGPEGIPGAASKANSELLWNSTPKGYQSVARFVNELTGGSAVESGAIDLRPGDYQVLAKFLTGSLGRFLSEATFGLKENLKEGIEGPKEIPVVKEFFTDPYNPLRSQTYHTNIASVYGAHKLESMYREGTERDLVKLHEVRKERSKDLRMYNQAQDVERQIKSLRVRIRAAESRNDSARVKALRGRIEEIQERFNNAYKRVS
jgi:hypothetical protein